MSGFVLGGGVTGLAAGMASGFTVLEAAAAPGGICASYYMRPDGTARLSARPPDEECYRFELGGGHWLFGGEPETLAVLRKLVPLASYERRASAFFPARGLHVPYPVQHHAALLGVSAALPAAKAPAPTVTLRDWLEASFGAALCGEFFFPFHELYTDGLYHRIAPQDAYKSPQRATDRGYNAEFLYPLDGFDAVASAM